MSLAEKLIKNSTVEHTSLLPNSKVFDTGTVYTTPVPIINAALSGSLEGGFTSGILCIAGETKRFKSMFALLMAATFLQDERDGVLLFYDSEFGTPKPYFDLFGIDMSRVVHTPLTDVEMLKHDMVTQLNQLDRSDKVMIILDSMGNLASAKEIEDAEEGRSKADYSRAKAFKSLYRMITPHLNLKDIPMVVINHTYKTMEMFSTDVVSGGTGLLYNADDIWIIGRQQEKVEKDVVGYHFIINIEKSRSVREKSKFPVTVKFSGGINRWSGMVDLALEGGFLVKPKPGYYQLVKDGSPVGAPLKFDQIESSDEFWTEALRSTGLAAWVEAKYSLSSREAIL